MPSEQRLVERMQRMKCPKCGRRNAAGAETCTRCGTLLRSAPVGSGASAGRRGSPRRMTLALALLLAVVGVGAAQSASLLQRAVVPEVTAGDIAGRVCSALLTQNYTLLTNQIDPTPEPPTAPAPFDAKALGDALRALDESAGKVTSCQDRQVSAAASSQVSVANFAVTVQREKLPVPQGILLILTRRPGQGWKVSRASNLTGSP